jgi:hypothetical protein
VLSATSRGLFFRNGWRSVAAPILLWAL